MRRRTADIRGFDRLNLGRRKLSSLSDEALMQRYSSGQSQAFELLYKRHRKGLFAFIRRQCNNHAVAEELAHDAWLAVLNRAGSDQ